jgi:hypothetical protein
LYYYTSNIKYRQGWDCQKNIILVGEDYQYTEIKPKIFYKMRQRVIVLQKIGILNKGEKAKRRKRKEKARKGRKEVAFPRDYVTIRRVFWEKGGTVWSLF